MKIEIENARIQLTGKCECGGDLVQVRDWRGNLLPEWMCSRSQWWNRKRNHAYLVMNAQIVPASYQVEAKKP